MSGTNEKIPAVLYTKKIYYISSYGPPTMTSLWIPSYELSISLTGDRIHKVTKKPFQTVEEQKATIEKYQLSGEEITDPKVQEILIDKEVAEKAREILDEEDRIESLKKQNNEKLKDLALQIPTN